MTISELHADEALRRHEFPVAANEVFLANAAVCPLPRRVAEEVTACADIGTEGDQEAIYYPKNYNPTRQLAADLLGCAREDIALIGPTSVGLSLVANGLPWREGDNVVYNPADYPSNAVVWMNLEKRGVEARAIPDRTFGNVTTADLEPLIDERTRLVSLASAHFVGGYRIDIDAIGQWLHERGVLFCVDGIQSLGAVRTPVTHVDFLAADAHKWMLGPCGAGIFYVSEAGRDILEPTLLGWNNVLCPNFVTQPEIAYKPDARKYEAGSANLFALAGLKSCLELLLEWGPENVERTVLGHTRYLRDAIRAKGYTLSGEDDDAIAGITAFRREGADLEALQKHLAENRIKASFRQAYDLSWWIRFAPHAYNTREELETAVELL